MNRSPVPKAPASYLWARRIGWRHWLAITTTLVLSVLPLLILSAAATSWPETPRPLSDEDRLELAVSADRSIGIVRVVRCRYGVEVDGRDTDVLDVIPVRWYNGGAGSAPLQLYSESVLENFSDVAKWLAATDSTAIVVTLKLHGRWFVRRSPNAYGGGVSPATKENRALLESRMKRVTMGLGLGGLTQRSDLIVVGRPGPGAKRCGGAGKPMVCHEVEVDSIVSGVRTSERVMMYDAAGLEPNSVASIIFLAATPTPGVYENVGFLRGRSPIESGRVRAFGSQRLPDLVRQIRVAAASTQSRRGR